MRTLIFVLVVLQMIGIASSAVAAIVDIESIVGTGPAFSLLGLLIAAVCYRRNLQFGFLFGLSVPTLSVFCFATIFGLQWSPSDAQRPIASVIVAFALLAFPTGIIALHEIASAATSKRPIKLQFGIAAVLGLVLVVAMPLGLLRAGREVGAAVGIVASYSIVAAFIVQRFYAGRSVLLDKNPNLRPCPDCGNFISVRATMCPHCGGPVKGA